MRLQARLFLIGQPLGLGRLVLHQHPPEEGPDDRRQTFGDEHHPPAGDLHEVATEDRHPQHRHRVAEDQEGVGPAAFGLGEPVGEVDQHRRHHRRLDDAEQEADDQQPGRVVDDPGQGRAAAPQDQADEHQLLDALPLGVDRAGDLEEEVAEEEQRPDQRRHLRRDLQVVRHPRRGREAVVGPIEVGQTVGDEDDRHDHPPPAWRDRGRLAHLVSSPEGVVRRLCALGV